MSRDGKQRFRNAANVYYFRLTIAYATRQKGRVLRDIFSTVIIPKRIGDHEKPRGGKNNSVAEWKRRP